MTTSQEFPMYTQSKGTQTLKVCKCCQFKTRNQEEYDEHLNLHLKCLECGTRFANDSELKKHFDKFYVKSQCEKCNLDVLQSEMEKHLEGHRRMLFHF